ncbi:hypothetical protein FOA52_006879 [Chlamydomonas sp. UWO 241]|nr:hypothetical protein FOA52_006879 [Chlamydomonas sp. UWO 241]
MASILRACGSLLRPAGGQELLQPWARAFAVAAGAATPGAGAASTSAASTTASSATGAVASKQQAAAGTQKPPRSLLRETEGPILECGTFHQLDASLLPEAALPKLGAGAAKRGRRGGDTGRGTRLQGCSGLVDEVAATRSPAVQYRQPIHLLRSRMLGKHATTDEATSAADATAAAPPPPSSLPPMRLLINGPKGSGKSVALAYLVERARAAGWICVYVPCAEALVKGGYFTRNDATGRYDTILSAQALLRATVAAHAHQLAAMPAPTPAVAPAAAPGADAAPLASASSDAAAQEQQQQQAAAGQPPKQPKPPKQSKQRSLLDVANSGLTGDASAADAVSAVHALISSLAAAAAPAPAGSSGMVRVQTKPGAPGVIGAPPRVLFAVDAYNALHGRTGYGRAVGEDGQREELGVEDLSLAASLRLLSASPDSLGHAVVVAATSATGSGPVPLPLHASAAAAAAAPGSAAVQADTFHMPRYSLVESGHALYWYWERGMLPAAPTKSQVEALHALTNGNARELRVLAPKLPLIAAGL